MTTYSSDTIIQTADPEPAPPTDVPVTFRPSGTGQEGMPLTYREARESPCLSCVESPCCSHLLVSEFDLDGIMDVDYALYLLNFDGIYLGLQRDWKVHVYLHQPCSLLDVPSGLCTVHSTPRQPAVCVHYKSHTCSYRKGMTGNVDADRPLIDYRRMAWLADQIVFDDDRRVVGKPQWEEVLEGFAAMPMQRRPAPPPPPNPVLEEWRTVVLTEKTGSVRKSVHRYGDPVVTEPCLMCDAYCCKVLVFPRGEPKTAGQIDFLRYCLGFPSVELGVSDEGWALIVNTTCRHLDGNRCSVFGQEERPLKCGYYDAMNCDHRPKFGLPQPDDILRVSAAQFDLVADSLMYDDIGRVAAVPPVRILRERLEQSMRIEWAMSQAASTEF